MRRLRRKPKTQDELCASSWLPRHDWGEWWDRRLWCERSCKNCGADEHSHNSLEFLQRRDEGAES